MTCSIRISEKGAYPCRKQFCPGRGRIHSVQRIAESLGYTRQYVYKQAKDAEQQQEKQAAVKELVDSHRKLLPRIGTRKLYHLMQEQLKEKALKMGRDKLFTLMRHYQLLIYPNRRYIQTTMSKHWMRKWPNLIKELKPQRPDQIWVSDITYLKTEQGNCYLNMVTDMYSRKIVGYAVAPNMETQSMIVALKMANKQRQNKSLPTLHHSDRGLQYCSKEYVEYTGSNNIQLSMTEQTLMRMHWLKE